MTVPVQFLSYRLVRTCTVTVFLVENFETVRFELELAHPIIRVGGRGRPAQSRVTTRPGPSGWPRVAGSDIRLV